MARITDAEFIKAVETSCSKTETLTKLGLRPKNYGNLFNEYVKRLNLDISHFKFEKWKKVDINDILINQKPSSSSTRLKKELIALGILEEKCTICHLTHWIDLPITLELDHIDGNWKNNNITNLRLLCTNCHSQTSTFMNKNRDKNRTQITKITTKFRYHISEYLSNKRTISSSILKKRLVLENLLENKCCNCGITTWCGNLLTLQLDHINGDRSNNNLSNLRIMCPICHSRTPTWAP